MAKEELKKEEPKKATTLVEVKIGKRMVKVGDNYLTGDVVVTEEMATIINAELSKPEKRVLNLGNTKISINGMDYTGVLELDNQALFEELQYRKSLADQNTARALNKSGIVQPGQVRDSNSPNIVTINGSHFAKVGGA